MKLFFWMPNSSRWGWLIRLQVLLFPVQFDAKDATGAKRYAITINVLTQDGMFRPERWCDVPNPTDLPLVGEHICLKVNLSVYQTKTGTNFRLTWGASTSGESF